MDQLNYATLEASRRLIEAGIVLDNVDMMWGCTSENPGKWEITYKDRLLGSSIPAPSIAEIWRELPEGTKLIKEMGSSEVYIIVNARQRISMKNENTVDALIDLLIWIKGWREKENESAEICLALCQ